jgi:replication factor A1
MPEHLLKMATPPKEFEYMIEREKDALMKKRTKSETRFLKIKDLTNGMKRVGLKGRVLAISRPKSVQTRYYGCVKFTTVTLKDETGTVKLALWNGRVNSLSVNDIVEIENASVRAYRGENQLRLGKNSRLRAIEDHDTRALVVRK